MDDDSIIKDQIEYYRLRASEYDEWHLRQGRYDRGEEHKRQWIKELGVVETALKKLEPFGDCLELACGTGLWTTRLTDGAESITAVDSSPEAIEINRAKIPEYPIRYEVADIFKWKPSRKFDFVFFGFWLSHVPEDKFESFWEMVNNSLKPGGRAFFVDSLQTQESTARDHAPINDSGVAERKLNDGREFKIVKIFYDSDKLMQRLNSMGWNGEVKTTGEFFIYGCMTRK